ncbi:MAG: hypothetical protein ACYTE3_30445 [Planctomycetota bacterium]|jgi:hypothetical protein
MKKQGILLAAVVLFSIVGLAQAQEDPLGVTLDATWVSKYLWYGIDMLDDKGAFQPSVDVDLFGSGFSINVWASYPTAAGDMNKGGGSPGTSRIDATEYDYTLAYSTVFCEGEPGAIAVTAHGRYYDFIDQPDEAGDAYVVGVQIAMPELCTGGVVPSYFVGRIWPAAGSAGTFSDGTPKRDLPMDFDGWVHIFGLSYDLKLAGLTPDTPEQVVSFSAAAVYNDGALFGIETSLELAENVHLTPAVYYQSSWEDTVNPEDEIVFSIGASCKF